ncbi:MAG: type II toxin-antitoxin system Phd/YefM family antitoxin [Anaerolineales bacterium]
MTKQYSIAEARHNLASIVYELDSKERIELTRRGEPVAVLISIKAYQRLSLNRADFWDAFTTFRDSVSLKDLKIEPEVLTGTRDRSGGREVEW